VTEKITRIVVDFAEPIEMPDGAERALVEIVSLICDHYECDHPGRVMWPAGIGSLPTFIPMTAEEERERGIEFDTIIFSIDCPEREGHPSELQRRGQRSPRQICYWRTIRSAPKDDTLFLAATRDGRIMIYRGDILATAMKETTPEHLSFPAVAWMPLPERPIP
jgi:hypothetical protein